MNPSDQVFMSFFKEIFILEHLARNRMEQALPGDMKVSHFTALSYLANKNTPSNPAELASAFQVSRPTMTNTLQKLEAKNYIRISADTEDGRGKLVAITKEGRKVFNLAIEALAHMFGDVAQNLGEDPFTQTLAPLRSIREYMDASRTAPEDN
jgi:DNA-binding MarR family transcriptional regulator